MAKTDSVEENATTSATPAPNGANGNGKAEAPAPSPADVPKVDPARKAALAAAGKDVMLVPYHRIELGPNMRQELRGIDELAKAIDEQGLLQNLVVFAKKEETTFGAAPGEKHAERYILIAGFRRHAAIGKIREQQPDAHAFVLCRVKRGNEVDMICAQAQENLQREDCTPAEIAATMQLLENRGLSRTQIAKRLGKTPSYVSVTLKWQETASEELKAAVKSLTVPFALALDIAKLPEKAQVAEIERVVAEGEKLGKATARKKAKKRVGEATGQHSKMGASDLRQWLASLLDENGKEPKPEAGTPFIVYRTIAGILGIKGFPTKDFPRPPAS